MLRFALLFVLLLAPAASAVAQDGDEDRFVADSARAGSAAVYQEKGWTPFFRHRGVALSVIHYRRADGHNGGVVLRLVNENAYAVRYRLTLAFLAGRTGPEEWKRARTEGVLQAGESRTGERHGLYWTPFEDDVGVAEIRLPAYQIVPVE